MDKKVRSGNLKVASHTLTNMVTKNDNRIRDELKDHCYLRPKIFTLRQQNRCILLSLYL